MISDIWLFPMAGDPIWDPIPGSGIATISAGDQRLEPVMWIQGVRKTGADQKIPDLPSQYL
jgi:hypothetical protein